MLQIQRKKNYSDVTVEIIEHYMEEVAKNHLPNIAKKLQVSLEEVQQACEEIRSLNPKPGSSFSDREQLRYISPDAVVVKLENQFEILINEYQYPGFSISNYYQEMMQSTTDAEAKKYLQEKVQQAQWVSNCISQRSSTLSRVMHLLVERQHEFFHGRTRGISVQCGWWIWRKSWIFMNLRSVVPCAENICNVPGESSL